MNSSPLNTSDDGALRETPFQALRIFIDSQFMGIIDEGHALVRVQGA